MRRDSLAFLDDMFAETAYPDFKILIINQTEEGRLLVSDMPNVRVINSFDTGLSKSRNLALKNAKGRLCLIADDDIVFRKGFDGYIINAFNANPDAALISFRTERAPGVLYKKYPKNRKAETNYLERLDIMSVEIVLNREITASNKIAFDENFGLGAPFGMGEEAVFVNDIYSKRLKIVMEPQVIVMHAQESSNTQIGLQEKFYVQGAVYTRIFKDNYFLWVLLKVLFSLKKNILSITAVPTAVNAAKKGHRAILKTDENKP